MYLKEFAEAMGAFRAPEGAGEAVLDAMVMCAYCDGRATVAEVQYIADLGFSGDLERAMPDILQATERLRDDGDFMSAMRRISAQVESNAQREEVLAYATAVLYADLTRTEAEGRALDALCELLHISGERGIEIVNQVVRNIETHDPIVNLPADRPLPAAYEKGVDWPGFRLPDSSGTGREESAGGGGASPAVPARPAAASKPAPKPKAAAKATSKAKATSRPVVKAKVVSKPKGKAKAASKPKATKAAPKAGARRPAKRR
ncbi:MAG TPA: TerB family tellurite resistance protein [Myxococcota bacterium]|jgi:hypothetical protein|nr:TerB family tellurite resistance protein [Myxococcota bacterium]